MPADQSGTENKSRKIQTPLPSVYSCPTPAIHSRRRHVGRIDFAGEDVGDPALHREVSRHPAPES
jgi:hypothetical protein